MVSFGSRKIWALPWILCFLACSPVGAQRLPTTVTPEHYDLAFDVDAARFEGVETIKVSLAAPSRRIVLNALDIQFHDVTIAAAGAEQKASVTLNEATQTAALAVARDVPAGPADI